MEEESVCHFPPPGAPTEEIAGGSAEPTEPLPSVQYAVAEYDFRSETGQALSFSAGDRLVLYCQASQDWWRGGNTEGQEGLIAASYIRLVSRDQLGADSDQEQQLLDPPDRQSSRQVSEDGVITRLPSFKSNIKMFEQKTLERDRKNSNTMVFDRDRKNPMVVKAPDLLNDVLNKPQETKVTEAPENKKDTLVIDTPV